MKQSLPDFLTHLDGLIRAGKGGEAGAKLQTYPIRSLAREHRARFCHIARRLRLHSLSLKVLNPIVRPTSRKVIAATEEEKAEYAAALSAVGAIEEAITIFRSLNVEEVPEILLTESIAHFFRWEYATAIPLLERYIQTPNLEPYWHMVGRANLATALVFERKPEAEKTIDVLLREADQNHHRILHGYALQLHAENAIWAREWKEARAKLAVAGEYFKDSHSNESLYIRKWIAIVDLFEGKKGSADELGEVKDHARRRMNWESIRSVDYHLAIARQDQQVLAHLLYGTPYVSLRERLLRDFGPAANPPKEYLWKLEFEKDKPGLIELSLDSLGEEKGGLQSGLALHRLLTALTVDFYRPLRIPELHSRIYSGEYFNPITSPHRIAQLINRSRRHFAKRRLPLIIEEKNSSYRLTSERPAQLRLKSTERSGIALPTLRYGRLREVFGTEEFDKTTASRVLSLSSRSTSRTLQVALEEGAVVRSGKGRNTRYRCK